MILKTIIKLGLQVFIVLLLFSCSKEDNSIQQIIRVNKIIIHSSPDTNKKFPVKVDLVLSYNSTISDILSKANGDVYFANVAQYKKDYPDMFEQFSWDVPAGQTVIIDKVNFKKLASIATGFFYARYLSPGVHRVRITEDRTIHVILGKDEISLQGEN